MTPACILLWHRHGVAQRGQGEFLCRHRLRKQKALHQIKTHLTHGKKVGSGLHALGYGAGAKAIGKVEDLAAYRLLQPVVGAAGDELERLMSENRAVLKRLKERG